VVATVVATVVAMMTTVVVTMVVAVVTMVVVAAAVGIRKTWSFVTANILDCICFSLIGYGLRLCHSSILCDLTQHPL